MFGRFGGEARRVIDLAEDHARALWRPAVGPEHLLLALLAVDDTGVFHRCGLSFDDVRNRLLDAGAGDPPPSPSTQEARHLPLRLREVFRGAFRHAASLGHAEVTPLHLGLALVDEPPGEIAMVLRHLEVKAVEVRDAILVELLDGDASRRPAGNVVALPRSAPEADDGDMESLRFSAAP